MHTTAIIIDLHSQPWREKLRCSTNSNIFYVDLACPGTYVDAHGVDHSSRSKTPSKHGPPSALSSTLGKSRVAPMLSLAPARFGKVGRRGGGGAREVIVGGGASSHPSIVTKFPKESDGPQTSSVSTNDDRLVWMMFSTHRSVCRRQTLWAVDASLQLLYFVGCANCSYCRAW